MADLVEDVNQAYSSDNQIDEMGIILTDQGPNILVVEHKLGISMSILKPMFGYAVPELYRLRSELTEHADVALVQSIHKVSLAALLVKGDFPPALDIRKSLIHKKLLCSREEIRLTSVIFSKHPKSPSCWYHRKWCIIFLLGTTDTTMESLVKDECKLCSRMCDMYPKNYYSWNHRLWIAGYMNDIQINDELDTTYMWLKKHVSDHSAVNHYTQVLLIALNRAAQRTPSVEAQVHLLQLATITSMRVVYTCAGHESLWYLRRMVATITCRCVALWIRHDVIREAQHGLGDTKRESNEVLLQSQLYDRLLQCLAATNEGSDGGSESSGGHSCERNQGNCDAEENIDTNLDRADALFAQLGQIVHASSYQEGVLWLRDWVRVEVEFFLACVGDSMSWDPEMQRLYGGRYLGHLLQMIIRTLCDVESEAVTCYDVNTPSIICPTVPHGTTRPYQRSPLCECDQFNDLFIDICTHSRSDAAGVVPGWRRCTVGAELQS